MTSDPEAFDPEDAELATRLADEPPRPGVALRRRVRSRIATAFEREALRRRAVILMTFGAAVLAVAIVLALSGPR